MFSLSIDVRWESLFKFQSDGRVARIVELLVHTSMSSWPITTTTLKRINENVIKNEPKQTTKEKTTKKRKQLTFRESTSTSHSSYTLLVAGRKQQSRDR